MERITYNGTNIYMIGTKRDPWMNALNACVAITDDDIVDANRIYRFVERFIRPSDKMRDEFGVLYINEIGLNRLVNSVNKSLASKLNATKCDEDTPFVNFYKRVFRHY
jgi:hypothetical protein